MYFYDPFKTRSLLGTSPPSPCPTDQQPLVQLPSLAASPWHRDVSRTWICCFCPVGPTWSPGKGVKSTRTCSPVGAIIPKRPGAFREKLRNSSSFPQEAEPSHSRCPGLQAPVWSRGKQLLLWEWFGKGGTGWDLQPPVPAPLWVNAPTLHPSGKPKKGRICDHWGVKYSQAVPPKASLPLNFLLPQFPLARLFQTEGATAPCPWWDKHRGCFPGPKWHFQG